MQLITVNQLHVIEYYPRPLPQSLLGVACTIFLALPFDAGKQLRGEALFLLQRSRGEKRGETN